MKLKLFTSSYILLVFAMNSSLLGATEDLDQKRQEVLKHIDEKITILQTNRSCVQSAQTREALDQCRESAKEARGGMRKKIKEERMKKMDEKIKMMQEKREKMNQHKD